MSLYATEARKAAAARYREENRAKANAVSAAWRKKNGSEIDRNYYNNNTDQIRIRISDYQKNNRDVCCAISARYKAQKLKATPVWANHDLISAIYKRASEMLDENGKVFHVDHIVPLQSDYVCGLHVENNLQILTGSENMSKQNRYWPDMAER